MKKIGLFLGLILLYSCSTTETEEQAIDGRSAEDRVVRMEFNTTKTDFDEIRINYYDYKTDTYILNIHQFSYDSAGNSIPYVITIENYDFRYVNGQAYRNNPSTEEISLKLYVDDELVVEDTARGENGEYAELEFEYDAGF